MPCETLSNVKRFADFFESSKNCKIVIVFLRFKSRRGKTVEVELICVILLCSLGIA